MHIETVFPGFAKLPSPVLTVYINTSCESATQHPRVRSELAWLLDAAVALRHNLSYHNKKLFDQQVQRVRRFLERHAAERSIVVFAGGKCWHVVPLRVSLRNELHWGKPSIASLLPLLYSHRRYGVVVIDHMAVRYFAWAEGDLKLLGSKTFQIDASQWKRKDQGRVGTERMQKSRGPLRDLYARRMEAQYKRLCHQVAEEIAILAKKQDFDGLLLVGPDRLIHPGTAAFRRQVARNFRTRCSRKSGRSAGPTSERPHSRACRRPRPVAASVFWRAYREKAITYETVSVERGSIQAKVTATGTLNAVVDVLVSSQVSGNIQALYADWNSKVKKGQLVALIDPEVLRAQVNQATATFRSTQAATLTAQGQLEKAKSDLTAAFANAKNAEAIWAKDLASETNAKAQWDRADELFREDIIALQDLDTAKANYDASQAQLMADRAQIDAAKQTAKSAQASVEVAENQLAMAGHRSARPRQRCSRRK